MSYSRIRTTALFAALAGTLSFPAHASEDPLGQFLDQNFPTIYAAETDDDPIRVFAERQRQQQQQQAAYETWCRYSPPSATTSSPPLKTAVRLPKPLTAAILRLTPMCRC